MICRNGHIVPDTMLACPACTQMKWNIGVAQYQHEFLRRSLAGLAQLKVIRAEPRHVVLFGIDLKRTFCGIELQAKPMAKRISYEPYSVKTLATVCPECRTAIAHAVEEAGKA
jgi:hypothetical protein